MSGDPHWLTERQADADAAALLRAHVERACTHRLWGEDDGLLCDGTHHPHGHTFTSATGSHLGEGEHHGREPE